MTAIETNKYIFKRIKDTFTISAKGSIDETINIYRLSCGDPFIPVYTGIINGGNIDTKLIIFNALRDGNYRLDYENADSIYFTQWKTIRNELISKIAKAICSDCGCKSVGCLSSEATNCLRNQELFTLLNTYQYLVKPYSLNTPTIYNIQLFNFLQRNINLNDCFILSKIQIQLANCSITGESKVNKDLFNYFVSIVYLALYRYDMSNIDTTILLPLEVEEEVKYINEMYNYKRLKNCIRNLGIDLSELEDTENLSKVYYWQADGYDVLLSDITPLINLPFIETQPVQNYDIFAQGYIINYTLTGRLIFFITNVFTINFVLQDSLGNDITDTFDYVYYSGLGGYLFVSKDFYTPSLPFFKFKTIG